MNTAGTAPTYLKVLHRGRQDAAIVGVDFTERRAVSSFPELASQFTPHDPTFVECDVALIDALPDHAEPGDYVRLVVDEVRAAGLAVVAVVGRCGGAGLACAVTDGLRAAGPARPVTVVFDPEVVDHEVAFAQFEKAMTGLVPGLDDLTVDSALRAFHDRVGHEDLAPTLDAMRDAYRTSVLEAISGVRAPADFGEFLAGRFAAFNRYLLCASRAPIAVPGDRVHRLLCRDHHVRGTERGEPALRLDAGHDELMASLSAAMTLSTLIGE